MPGSPALRFAAVALIVAAILHLIAPLLGASVPVNLIVGVVLLVLAFVFAVGLRVLAWPALPLTLILAAGSLTAVDLPILYSWTLAALELLAGLALIGALWSGRNPG